MAIQNYHIILRVDVTSDGEAAMDEVVRQGAVQLRSMVVLLNQGRYKPSVDASRSNGVFEKTKIELDQEAP